MTVTMQFTGQYLLNPLMAEIHLVMLDTLSNTNSVSEIAITSQ